MDLAAFLSPTKSDETLTSLASKAKVAVSYLHDIKTGRREPSLKVAMRIEEATGGKVTAREMLKPADQGVAP